MKKLTRMAMLIATMSFMTFQVFSQTTTATSTGNQQKSGTTTCCSHGKFVDSNNDGICDNHATGMKNGKCAGFVDKNGDGICDNQPANCKGKANCNGKGMQTGQGKGNCAGAGKPCQRYCGKSGASAPAAQPKK